MGQESSDSQLTADLENIHELIHRGQSETALEKLQAMTDSYPERLDILFLLGITVVEVSYSSHLTKEEKGKLLDEAIFTFQAMLSKEPHLHRVHLELARAYFLKGEDSLAKKHFKQVLKEETPLQVEENINHFLTKIKERRPWFGRISFEVMYDSNIGKISDEDTIYIYGLPFTLINKGDNNSGMGLSLRANGERQHKINKKLHWRTGGSIDHKEQEGGQFDEITIQGYTGPRWLLNQANEMSLLVGFRHSQRGNNSNYQDVSVRIETGHHLGPVKVSIQTSNYDHKSQLHGEEKNIQKYELKGLFNLTSRLQAQAKIGQEYDKPKFSYQNSSLSSIEVGLKLTLTQKIILDLSKEEQKVKYQGNWFPYIEDETSRRDQISFARLKVHLGSFELFGFRPYLSLVKEKRESNAQLHSYKRNFIGLNFIRDY
ncbi:MAG: tetratricopeptide repeat protein [Oligoflexia bacterium]|nr:tetratricopeptide repeat protein [Oligoflexia bacterium]